MPMITASTGTSLRLGARRAELPWQNMTNSPIPAPTLSTATMVFAPGRNLAGSFSSTSCGRTSSSLRPAMEASFLVATTDPSTLARNMMLGPKREAQGAKRLPLPASRFPLRQHGFYVGVRSGNDVHADQVAFNRFNGLGAGVGRGFDCGNI